MKSVSKTLSANDIGATGGHQAGILIPKDPRILNFFPHLDPQQYNPRCHLKFTDSSGTEWDFAFIYYNNVLFSGTRNEYRLTRMTRYIRESGLNVDDEIILTCDDNHKYLLEYKRCTKQNSEKSNVIKLGAGWKIINI